MSTTNQNRPRYTIDLDPAARDHLNELAKSSKLTQGEVIEVLLRIAPEELLQPAMRVRREQKLAERTRQRELLAKLRALPADALAQVEALVAP